MKSFVDDIVDRYTVKNTSESYDLRVSEANERLSDSITTTSDTCSSVDPIDDDLIGDTTAHYETDYPEHQFSSENLIVFDYDDTLFPTSFLAQSGYRLDGPDVSDEIKSMLDDYSEVVRRTLQQARKIGAVIILTNAETGWIELTSRKFTPSLSDLFESFPLLSARSTFEPMGISSPFQWKLRAFEVVMNKLRSGSTGEKNFNVISIGDSIHERNAVHQVCGNVSGLYCKSIKFMERPDLSSLAKQHHLIADCLHEIVSYPGALDMCVQCQPRREDIPN
jgi:hypothetical protein